MGLFDYRCPDGHVHELVRSSSQEGLPCPTCGKAATRSHVHRFDVVGPTIDSRGMYRRYTEASQEIDHKATRIEEDRGVTLQTPNLWKAGKARANAMAKAGEPFRALDS